MKHALIRRLTMGALALGCIVGAACKKEEPAPQAALPGVGDTARQAVGDAANAAKLAAADEMDGAADKTIGKCVMCALRMDGSAEHASTHAGYTLHFCSAGCKKHFDEGPGDAIAKLTD